MPQMYYKTSGGTLVPIGSYVINDPTKVSLTGTETVAGAKTFSSSATFNDQIIINKTGVNSVLFPNSTSMTAKNAAGTYEEFFWPRWNDDKMYTNFGANGWVIRSSSSVVRATFDSTGLLTLNNGLTVSGVSTLSQGYATTATAAGTTTLTATSGMQQFLTGTTTQIVVLPVTSTLSLGQQFVIHNNATTNANTTAPSSITVRSSGANDIYVVPPGGSATFTCILTSGTTAASWDVHMDMPLTPAYEYKNAAYVITPGDSGKFIEFTSASTTSVTLDASASIPIGFQVTIIRGNTGAVWFSASGTTIYATPGTNLRAQWSSATAIKRTSNTWLVIGDLAA